MVLLVLLLLLALAFYILFLVKAYSFYSNTTIPSNLHRLSNVQVRYKIGMCKSICVITPRHHLRMFIYPIDSKTAKIEVPMLKVNTVHKCSTSLLDEITELIESDDTIEVYDGEDFIASIK